MTDAGVAVPIFKRGPVPANRLEELLLALKGGTSASRMSDFYAELLRTKLTVIGRVDRLSGRPVSKGSTSVRGDRLHAQVVRDSREVWMVPVFSSDERFRDYVPENDRAKTPFVTMSARDIFESCGTGRPFSLNPGTPSSWEVTQAEVDALLGGKFPEPPTHKLSPRSDIKWSLRIPPVLPERLVAALQTFFLAESGVEAAYLSEASVPGDGGSVALRLVIHVTVNSDQVFQAVLHRLQPILLPFTKDGGKLFIVASAGPASVYPDRTGVALLVFSRQTSSA